MAIRHLQLRLRELGRIRMGDQVPTKSGRTRPRKLQTFRLTSETRALIVAAADRYGGDVTPWDNAGQRQWQVTIEADALPCQVPPGHDTEGPVSQWMELWAGGGCQRRCDGVTETLQVRPCVCRQRYTVTAADGTVDESATWNAIADASRRPKKDGGPDGCQPVTRLGVWLHELPGIGVWRLETHGRIAAAELAGVAQFLAAASAAGKSVPAVLRIVTRRIKRPGQPPNEFIVPALDVEDSLGNLLSALGKPIGERAQLHGGDQPAPLPGRRGTQRVPLEGQPALPTGDDAAGTADASARPPIGDTPAPGAVHHAGNGDVVDVDVVDVSGAPPMPPPPPDPEGAQPAPVIDERTRRQLMARLSEAGFGDDDARHDLIWLVTGGATASSTELDERQWDQVMTALDLVLYDLAMMGTTGEGDIALVKTDGDGNPTLNVVEFPLDVAAVQAHLATLPSPDRGDNGEAGS